MPAKVTRIIRMRFISPEKKNPSPNTKRATTLTQVLIAMRMMPAAKITASALAIHPSMVPKNPGRPDSKVAVSSSNSGMFSDMGSAPDHVAPDRTLRLGGAGLVHWNVRRWIPADGRSAVLVLVALHVF